MIEEIKGDEVAESVEVATTEKNADVQGEEKQKMEKKYTDADVDRIISKKIAAERKRMQKLFNEEQQESELEKRERAVLLREMKADAKDTLIERGLPSSLAGLLNYSDKETLENSLNEVGKIFNAAVEQSVKSRLRGETPRRGSSVGDSKEQALHNAFKP